MSSPADPSSPAPFSVDAEDFPLARLRWLVRLRWIALFGILGAAAFAGLGAVPGVSWPVLVATAAAAAVYNLLLWRTHRRDPAHAPSGRAAAMGQALVDLLLLTAVLWAAGGVRSPFVVYYVFHVALVGILAGPRATLIAAAAAIGLAALLALTEVVPALQIGAWDPVPPWDIVAEVCAFTSGVGAVAYLVTHAVRELRDRERKLARARDRAALEYQLLSSTLNELEAGLEVVDQDGRVVWRNKRAEVLAPYVETRGVHGGESGRVRFAAQVDDAERVYEMLVLPLQPRAGERARVMHLYVDRTQATLSERRLVLAERLASLGRIAQGVAHELNTPLATIRTLAADTRAALRAIADLEDPDARSRLVADVDESAALVHDETRRLGRITQALLAGGDLVRTHIEGAVPVAAVVERARALVFAGVRRGPAVEVSPSVDTLAVAADPDRLMQVLVNLLQNAVDAVRDRTDAHVNIRAANGQDGSVEIAVEDDGPGIDPSIEGRVFEPFTTTKPPGQGTGLGLYTSYMLVQAMNGSLHLERREEGGTRALVRLPGSGRSAAGVTEPAEPAGATR